VGGSCLSAAPCALPALPAVCVSPERGMVVVCRGRPASRRFTAVVMLTSKALRCARDTSVLPSSPSWGPPPLAMTKRPPG